MQSEIILSTTELAKHFGGVHALRGVSLQVLQGSITAIVGDNGSGKSTLIKLLSGNLKPDSGSISIAGATYPGLTVRQSMRLGIRTLYQDLALDPLKNSVENIFLGQETMRGPFLGRRQMRRQAQQLLQQLRVQIPDLTLPVGNLSGGQRQAVAMARALRQPGRLLLLDEPTAAMGLQESLRTMQMLKDLKEQGMTQLLISHNLQQVFAVADYVYVMRSGRLLAGVATGETTLPALQALILQQESGGMA